MPSAKQNHQPAAGAEDLTSQSTSGGDIVSGLAGLVLDGLVLCGVFLTAKLAYKIISPLLEDLSGGEKGRATLSSRLKKNNRPVFHTTSHENMIAADLVDPDEIEVTFSQIGGLEQQKQLIYELVVWPLKHPELFASGSSQKLLPTPKGILLYGEPGTGKTMLAKAIAKESGAFFLDLKLSTLLNKWVGESQKLVHATFTLAHKLAPCIIFIDEVDAFMGDRSSGGGNDPVFVGMKTQFMALWDGFLNNNSSSGFGVVVLGATNRPQDVDPAFLRRMPRTFEVSLPQAKEREQILRLHLADEVLDRNVDFRYIADVTEYYSGSDLKELCRAAIMLPLREHIQQTSSLNARGKSTEIRPLCMNDFIVALKNVKQTGKTADDYAQKNNFPLDPTSIDPNMFAMMMMAGMKQMFQMTNTNQQNQ